MYVYTAALPNKPCQQVIDQIYPNMRYMLSPATVRSFGVSRHHILKRGYAIDNGAYNYYLRKVDFDEKAFYKLLDTWATGCDWVAIPDSVGNWEETKAMLDVWVPRLLEYKVPLLVVVQDGSEVNNYKDVHMLLDRMDIQGIFVGGTTDWKLSNIQGLSDVCKQHNKHIHVGRVNSVKRLKHCFYADVDSVDGSGMSRFTETSRS
jgi:hypothetical protein